MIFTQSSFSFICAYLLAKKEKEKNNNNKAIRIDII